MTINLRDAFNAQYEYSRKNTFPSLEERCADLEKLAQLLRDNSGALINAISQDFGSQDFGGRSPDETRILEIFPTIHSIEYAIKNLKKWIKPIKKPVDMMFQPAKAWLQHQPLGVIGIIGAWNYPLMLTLVPLCDALAAGNSAMIKPSDLSPLYGELLADLIGKNFAPEKVVVINGGLEIAKEFSSIPFDHLIFTGSTNVGRLIMAAAAPNLTPVTLELGGKSPAIIAPDYPIEKAAHSIAFGKFVNAGQTCIAPDYALIPNEKAVEFCETIIKKAQKFYPKINENNQYTNIITQKHSERLLGAINEAKEGGAKIYTHKETSSENGKIPPTIILNPKPDSLIMREEIFGPILPVVTYDDLSQAINFINAKDRPLALYAFTNDVNTENKILKETISGGVTINGTLLHVAQSTLPFGGIGASGIGAYHGYDGFKRFSHARGIHKTGFINPMELMGPPWGALSKIITKFMGGI